MTPLRFKRLSVYFCAHPSPKQTGFSLFEVLISLLIFGMGLLGLAALQLNTLKFNQESQYRLAATNLLNSMADRMRANPVGVSGGNYDAISDATTNPNCSSCTPAQLAQLDGYNWNQETALLLPAGQAEVQPLGNQVFDLIIRWDAQHTGATGTSCSGNAQVDLTCVTMRVAL